MEELTGGSRYRCAITGLKFLSIWSKITLLVNDI